MPCYKLTVIPRSSAAEEMVGEIFFVASPLEARRIGRTRASTYISCSVSKKVCVFALYEKQWRGFHHHFKEIDAFLEGEHL
jgi:hypothetical protein